MPGWKTLVLMAACFAAGYVTALYDTIHALNAHYFVMKSAQ